jgi:hypothetical protein
VTAIEANDVGDVCEEKRHNVNERDMDNDEAGK